MQSKISIVIPNKEELLRRFCSVKVASKPGEWTSSWIEPFQKKRGLNIFHSKEAVLYVGITGGKKMDYATRLYRHLYPKAGKSHGIHKKLSGKNGELMVSFMTDEEIKPHIKLQNAVKKEKRLQKSVILIMEAALIHAYQPKFQKGDDATVEA